jgi:hypothetical protein
MKSAFTFMYNINSKSNIWREACKILSQILGENFPHAKNEEHCNTQI